MTEIIDDNVTFTITLTSTETQALGKIVDISCPVSVVHGAEFYVNASTENIGTAPGVFKMQLFINGILISTSPDFTLADGAVSDNKIPPANAPSSGNSMNIAVKCIRII